MQVEAVKDQSYAHLCLNVTSPHNTASTILNSLWRHFFPGATLYYEALESSGEET